MAGTTRMLSDHNERTALKSVASDVMPFARNSITGKLCAMQNVMSAASVTAQIQSSGNPAPGSAVRLAPQREQLARRFSMLEGFAKQQVAFVANNHSVIFHTG